MMQQQHNLPPMIIGRCDDTGGRVMSASAATQQQQPTTRSSSSRIPAAAIRIRTNPNYFGVEFRCKDGRIRSTYVQIDPDRKSANKILFAPCAAPPPTPQHSPSLQTTRNSAELSNINYSTPPKTQQQQPHQSKSTTSLGQSIRSGLRRHRTKQRPTLEVLSWSSDHLFHPLLDLKTKLLRKQAIASFDLIQSYMGDKATPVDAVNNLLSSPEINLVCIGWNHVSVRNEIYMQLIKQTTNNGNLASLRRGFELIAICLWFFPPSPSYRVLVESHVKHIAQSSSSSLNICAKACLDRISKIARDGPRKGLKNPSPEEVELAKRTIYHISMFGSPLAALMGIQSSYLPDDGLPWILTLLSNEVLRLNGAQTEGIFRIPGDIDRVNVLKAKCDRWNLLIDRRTLIDVLVDNNDPHVPASLLKLWYRELPDPLIPNDLYDECTRVDPRPRPTRSFY